jgi:hypothetical protein
MKRRAFSGARFVPFRINRINRRKRCRKNALTDAKTL